MPALLEAHYAVPALGAVLNPLNVRLDARDDRVLPRPRRRESRCSPTRSTRPWSRRRWRSCDAPPLVVDIDDPRRPGRRAARRVALRSAARGRRPAFAWPGPARRMGLARAALHVGHDRRSQGRRLSPPRRVPQRARQRARVPARARTASTCGRCRCSIAAAGRYTWAVTAAGATHVCLRRVEPARSSRAIRDAPRHAPVRRADRAQPARARARVGEAVASTTWSTSRPAAPRRPPR